MKRFAALLIVLLLLSSSAVAADRDEIIGNWYMYVDGELYPEFVANFAPCNEVFCLYSFRSDGTITLLELDLQGNTGTPVFSTVGKWEKNGLGYSYSIIGLGSGNVKLQNDELLVSIQTAYVSGYMRLYKITAFNPYSDYIFNNP